MKFNENIAGVLSPTLKEMVLARGGLKSYITRAESLGVTHCDFSAIRKADYIEVRFVACGVAVPGHYCLVLGPQGRVVSKETVFPSA
ncbi:Uncharacterised protein [BD1-7 clade bacterium]|uniref:Uncharacterized protein n=1 Tax=BD1-7 clade bacterium TaxID=2029982 RepID=A0A5S9PWM4_9GAMM|nr:Uncharacterised protein [BD1-7 clade bacterium]CAA0113343.1 Uncharacterised protein [BD1-7 clade bacterium]